MQQTVNSTAQLNPFGEQFRTFHFYPSESHKKVVHRITRGLECNCGLILLTGEIGIGKTSVCRHIVQSFDGKYIFAESGNPFFKPAEQLYNFCKQFNIDTTGRSSISDLTESLHNFFIEQAEAGVTPVIIMDESHLLAEEHFSLLLVLYNMRLGATPLVQIILVGQVEIMDRLRQPGLEALNQRIGVRCELSPMNKQETQNYIQFRLTQSEFPDLTVFDNNALGRIWHVTGGLPRLINHICSHALDSIAFSGTRQVTSTLIDKVAADPMYQGLFTIRTKKERPQYALWAGIFLGTILLGWGLSSADLSSLIKQAKIDNEPSQSLTIDQPSRQFSTTNTATVENKILTVLPQMPTPPVIEEAKTEQSLTIATKNSDISVTLHTPLKSETALPVQVMPEKLVAPNTATTEFPDIIEDDNENNTIAIASSLDEPTHPALEALQIDAVAWSEEASSRMVVIGSQILHEGDYVGQFLLKTIGRDHLVFSLGNIEYKKNRRPQGVYNDGK